MGGGASEMGPLWGRTEVDEGEPEALFLLPEKSTDGLIVSRTVQQQDGYLALIHQRLDLVHRPAPPNRIAVGQAALQCLIKPVIGGNDQQVIHSLPPDTDHPAP